MLDEVGVVLEEEAGGDRSVGELTLYNKAGPSGACPPLHSDTCSFLDIKKIKNVSVRN